MGSWGSDGRRREAGVMGGPLGERVQRTIAVNALALARLGKAMPQTLRNPAMRNVAGKVWNSPNTAIGLVYGGLGHVAGEVAHATPGLRKYQKERPGVSLGHNAVEFRNNPFAGVSAITLGNASTYSRGYDDEAGVKHEEQHTYQGEQLGPAYLPSNLLGGLNALAHGQDWHGDHNWNERGPRSDPPRPWAARKPR